MCVFQNGYSGCWAGGGQEHRGWQGRRLWEPHP